MNLNDGNLRDVSSKFVPGKTAYMLSNANNCTYNIIRWTGAPLALPAGHNIEPWDGRPLYSNCVCADADCMNPSCMGQRPDSVPITATKTPLGLLVNGVLTKVLGL